MDKQKAIRKATGQEGAFVDMLNQEIKELQESQKQIEEMAKIIEEAMAKARRTLGGHNNIAMFYATMLTNAGYRKIPESPKNTVLTNDDIAELLTIVAKETRKETAKWFAERVKEIINLCEDISQKTDDCLCEDIDEILKEITEGERCVVCGDPIPEGRQVCPKCEKESRLRV